MRNNVVCFILSLVLATSAGAFLTACKTPQSVQTISYKTLRSVAESVDSAMRTYAQAVALNRVTPEMQAKVRDLHGRYQPALEQAVVAARFNFEAAAPEEIAGLAAEITTTILTIIKKD